MGDWVSGVQFGGADTDMMMIGPGQKPELGLGLSVQ